MPQSWHTTTAGAVVGTVGVAVVGSFYLPPVCGELLATGTRSCRREIVRTEHPHTLTSTVAVEVLMISPPGMYAAASGVGTPTLSTTLMHLGLTITGFAGE
jgi:hypothetical protein